ncbi:MAG: DUF7670 domain-containing protein [Planctomycetota bacterium]|jgi:hypothetical protein
MTIKNKKLIHRIIRNAARTILVLWVGFWTWFVLMHLFTDGLSSLYHGSKILVPMLAAIVTTWFWPRIGGVLLIMFGIATMFYFDTKGLSSIIHPLTTPPIVCGLLIIMFGRKSP